MALEPCKGSPKALQGLPKSFPGLSKSFPGAFQEPSRGSPQGYFFKNLALPRKRTNPKPSKLIILNPQTRDTPLGSWRSFSFCLSAFLSLGLSQPCKFTAPVSKCETVNSGVAWGFPKALQGLSKSSPGALQEPSRGSPKAYFFKNPALPRKRTVGLPKQSLHS